APRSLRPIIFITNRARCFIRKSFTFLDRLTGVPESDSLKTESTYGERPRGTEIVQIGTRRGHHGGVSAAGPVYTFHHQPFFEIERRHHDCQSRIFAFLPGSVLYEQSAESNG